MSVKIIVLSDGTWQSIKGCHVWEITEDGYDDLCNGDIRVTGLKEKDVLNIREVE